jgi:hypothetical protein
MTRRYPLVILLFLVAVTTVPTIGAHHVDAQSAAGTDAQITEASILGHLEFLASDALQGRGSGTRDEHIATTYIAAQFRRWGLEPMGDDNGFVQTVEVIRESSAAPPVVTVGSTQWTHGTGLLVSSLAGVRTTGTLHHFADGKPVPPGAVVLMPAPPEGQTGRRGGGPPAASTAGAAAVMTMATPQALNGWAAAAERPVSAGSRLAGVALTAPRAARITLNPETHATISSMPDGTPVTIQATLTGTSTYTWNAVGRLTGSDPAQRDDVIVLGAHLDHVGMRENAPGDDKIFNGADDDASGTVAVMELAQALAAGPRSKRTLVFALFGSEEAGGFGAGYFVDKPVVAHERMIAQLQFEMLGREDAMVPSQHLWLTGYERSNLGAELAKHGALLVQDPRPDQSFFTRSDNIRFARRGIVAHTVSSFNLHTDYHKASDEISGIDLAHMTRAIRSMLEPVRWLANSTFKPEWAPGGRPQ